MQESPETPVNRSPGYGVTPGEILLLTVQSLLLAASLAVNALFFLRHYFGLSVAASSTVGLLAGLLVGYPTMRITARADGVALPFYKWAAVCLTAAGIAFAAFSAF